MYIYIKIDLIDWLIDWFDLIWFDLIWFIWLIDWLIVMGQYNTYGIHGIHEPKKVQSILWFATLLVSLPASSPAVQHSCWDQQCFDHAAGKSRPGDGGAKIWAFFFRIFKIWLTHTNPIARMGIAAWMSGMTGENWDLTINWALTNRLKNTLMSGWKNGVHFGVSPNAYDPPA